MPCPHCQAQTGPADAYCISCGARLGAPGAVPVPASAGASHSTPALPAARPGLRVVLVVLLNLLLLGGSAYLVYALLHRYAAARGPAEAVRLGVPRVVASVSPRPAPDAATDARADASRLAAAAPREPRKGKPARPGSSTTAPAALDAGAAGTAALDGGASDRGATPGAGTGAGSGTGGSAAPEADSAEQVRATLDADSVRMVVNHHMPQIRACYDRALKQQQSIRGTVEIKFEVTAQGRVGSAAVHQNTTGHPGLGACIANALRSWRFPRPVGGDVTFIYPFVFASGD